MLLNHFTLLLGKVKFCQHARQAQCPPSLPPRANRVNYSIQFSEPKWKRVAAKKSYVILIVEKFLIGWAKLSLSCWYWKMRRNSWIQPVSMYISLQINFSLSVVGALSTIIRYAPAPIFEYVFENLCSYLSFHGVHNDWWLVSLVIWNRFLDCLCQLLLFPSFTRWPPQPVAVAWLKTFWYE